jgi:maltose-binding protein MalE
MSQRFSVVRRVALAAALVGFAASAQAVTEIQFWHGMTLANNDRINDFAKKFNESQNEYKVTAVFKGTYPEAMAAAVAAYRAGSAPAILQVFEVGTATMMASKGAIKPVYQVMADAGEKFDPKEYIPAVAGYYTNTKGQMLSFPFNSSTTVFYYNQEAFAKAGLDPNRRPGQRRAASPPAGSRGSSSRASRPGTTRRSRPRKTASPATIRSSSSTAHCTCGTSATCRNGRRRATSRTLGARPSQRRSSSAANARC